MTERPWWLYLVLTFDPRDFSDRTQAFRRAGELWDHRLRKVLEREYGRLEYVQTWERHRSGFPHLNVLLGGRVTRAQPVTDPHLAEIAPTPETDWTADTVRMGIEAAGLVTRRHGKTGRVCTFSPAWRQWIRARAMRAGFGPSIWCEVIDNRGGTEAMSRYLLKLARELTDAPSKKGDQSPLEAPRHFRRIRASKGTLPPTESGSGEWTGRLFCHAGGANVRRALTGEVEAGPRAPGQRAGIEVPKETVDAWAEREARSLALRWSPKDTDKGYPPPPLPEHCPEGTDPPDALPLDYPLHWD